MNSLNQFLEVIEVAKKPIKSKHKAYKMDSTDKNKHMRNIVGLGSCHCCDYFLPEGDAIILIEETQIIGTVRSIKKKYSYLGKNDMKNFIYEKLNEENQLKAYGSTLVLGRLAAKFGGVKNIIENKKIHFWLVASNISSSAEKRYFAYLKNSLRKVLTQVLGNILLDDVKVFSSQKLINELSQK